MTKLLLTFTFLFSVFTLISAITEKQGLGFAATELTAAMTDSSASISVRSTDGFLDSDYVIIDSEYIRYTAKTGTTFTGLTRGYKDTNAASHNLNRPVRNNEASLMNTLAGYNIGEVMGESGPLGIFIAPMAYFKVFISMLAWNYSFLEGQMVILKYVLTKIKT